MKIWNEYIKDMDNTTIRLFAREALDYRDCGLLKSDGLIRTWVRKYKEETKIPLLPEEFIHALLWEICKRSCN